MLIVGLLIILTTSLFIRTRFTNKFGIISALFNLILFSTVYFLFGTKFLINLELFLACTFLGISLTSRFLFWQKRKYYQVLSFWVMLIPAVSAFFISPYKFKTTLPFTFLGLSIGFVLDQIIRSNLSIQSILKEKHFQAIKPNLDSHFAEFSKLIENEEDSPYLTAYYLKTVLKMSQSGILGDEKIPALYRISKFWCSQAFINPLSSIPKLFQSLNLKDIQYHFTFFDLNQEDLPWIQDLFRCGCWKIGLYALDQFLVSNKQSGLYTSSLLWSDKILNDLKKISFDDETIENWLMDYKNTITGTPLSAKIQLIYHNKDDWFEKSFRHAVI